MDPTKNEHIPKIVVSKKRNDRATKPSLAKNDDGKILMKRVRKPNSRYLMYKNVESVKQSRPIAIEKAPSGVSLEVIGSGRKAKDARKNATTYIKVPSVESSKAVPVEKVPSEVVLELTAPGAGKQTPIDINVSSIVPEAAEKVSSDVSAGKTAIGTKVNKLDSHGTASGRNVIKKRKKCKKVRYEVDCTEVDIDMGELQQYLQLQMIVAGKKNNDCLKVKSTGKTIIVRSAVYVNKHTLRFVTKKYLQRKKFNTIRVLSKARESYQLKYAN